MDNHSILYEIESINKEVSLLKKTLKRHNDRINTLTQKLVKNCEQTGETKIRYNGKNYNIKEMTKHVRKNEKLKRQDTIEVFREFGIDDSDVSNLYEKVVESFKGNAKTVYKIK